MSAEQLRERDTIVQALTKANWKASDLQKMFETGGFAYYEVEMTYENGKVRLTIQYPAEQRVIYFRLQTASGKMIALQIRCLNVIKQVLNAIVDFQDRISAANYKDELRSIVRLCPETYTSAGSDEETVVRLVDKTLDEKS